MKKHKSRKQWRRKQKIRRFYRLSMMTLLGLGLMIIGLHVVNTYILEKQNPMNRYTEEEFTLDQVELGNGVKITADLIQENQYSRPGTTIEKINGIVIHYVGNPGTTAQNNRDYFDSLAETGSRYASSHFVVGLEGEVIQCIPLNEESYASNNRNSDTIAIEVCHPDDTGKFNDSTYESVVELTAYLCEMFELDESDVIRHYDVTGKICPKYFVEHEDAWLQFKEDVGDCLKHRTEESEDGKDEDDSKDSSEESVDEAEESSNE